MNNSYLYTETAFHHQGDVNFLKELIVASAEAGAQGVKFQVLTSVDDFVSTKHKAYDNLRSYCLSKEQWKGIFDFTLSKKLEIVMMPLNIDALTLLNEFKVRYLDLHSVSFYDQSLLEHIRESANDLILGAGGRTLEEINQKLVFFGAQLKVLMVGFQSFPTQLEDIRLARISMLRNIYPQLEIGYADHTTYESEYTVISSEYARLLGASIFEKHITVCEGVDRVDFSAAVGPEKIKLLADRLRYIDQVILSKSVDALEMSAAEIVYRNRQLRCVASNAINAGTTLTKDHIKLRLVDDQDFTFYSPDQLIGKKLKQNVSLDERILSHFVI